MSGHERALAPAARSRAGRRRTRLLLALLLLGGCSAGAGDADDAFVSFRPSIDQFPAPPSPDAATRLGVIEPARLLFECSPWSYGYDEDHVVGAWSGIRYDWSGGAAAKSWVLGVQTVSYSAPAGDAYQNALEAAADCVFESSLDGATVTTEAVELTGLPDNAIALHVMGDVSGDRSRPLDAYAVTIIDDATDDPDERSRVVGAYWVGWDSDVSPDEFVDFVNSMVGATNTSG